LPLDYIYDAEFDEPGFAKRIVDAPRATNCEPEPASAAGNLNPYVASLYRTPLLTSEQEQQLFRKYNYLKFRAAKLRAACDPSNPPRHMLDEIEQLHARAEETRNQIIQANLRLVVALAKKRVGTSAELADLISDGNMSLIRAVEGFDYARGYRFSSYAARAIINDFARSIPTKRKRQVRFRNSMDDRLGNVVDHRSDQRMEAQAEKARREQVKIFLSRLSQRERQIVVGRFGLDYGREPQTLKDLGRELGVTKERVRQLECRAIRKLQLAPETAFC
jgi:RNA polymerase primary sigma factor/RNA polymerase sigma factor